MGMNCLNQNPHMPSLPCTTQFSTSLSASFLWCISAFGLFCFPCNSFFLLFNHFLLCFCSQALFLKCFVSFPIRLLSFICISPTNFVELFFLFYYFWRTCSVSILLSITSFFHLFLQFVLSVFSAFVAYFQWFHSILSLGNFFCKLSYLF